MMGPLPREDAKDMHDMLVKLYDLDTYLAQESLSIEGITIRKPIGPEKQILVEWITKKFYAAWGSEFDMALANRPITCFVAVKGKEPVGFACYDATTRGFFGPMGVLGPHRGKGLGRSLALTTLVDMRACGYAYAIIGGVGPADFYKKVAGAADIPDSTDSIWRTWIQ
jgi:hypothetical protein